MIELLAEKKIVEKTELTKLLIKLLFPLPLSLRETCARKRSQFSSQVIQSKMDGF